MKLRIIGTLIVSVSVALAACKPRPNSSTKAIVTKDRQNAVAFLPMRQYSTSSMLEIRAVSCGQDPSLSSGKPEVLMNILESGVRIDPAALYYRGTILVTANDSLINIQGYAISHNCRVQLSVPAIGATGFYALFADKTPELEPVRQTIWLALRGPYRGSGTRAPTLDAFISEVLQATRTSAKASKANELLDQRYNPCVPKSENSAFDKLKYYSCLVESGSPAANYLSKTDNLPEIREKLNKLANEFANKQVSEAQIDQVADLFGMNFVIGGSMAIRKTGAVARLASLGLDQESGSDSGLSLQGNGASIFGSQTVTKFEPLTKGSGSLSQVNPEYYKRESQSLDRVPVSPEKKPAWDAAREKIAANKPSAAKDTYPYASMDSLAGNTYKGPYDAITSDGVKIPRPNDPAPSAADLLLAPRPQADYRPKPQGGVSSPQGASGGFSIDPNKVPGLDPTKPGVVTTPKPFSGNTPVDAPNSNVDDKPAQGATTYASRCKDLGGTVVGVLCVCPDEGGPNGKVKGARLTVNPENRSEISCTRKREYLAQEQAKEAATLETKKKEELSRLEQLCRAFNATLALPADRKILPDNHREDDRVECVCNNQAANRFSVTLGSYKYAPLNQCLTNQQITNKSEDCRNNRNGTGFDAQRGVCTCPDGWVLGESDRKCHWASMAWLYKDAPKEVSHYEKVNEGSWLDRINPFHNFWEKVKEPLIK